MLTSTLPATVTLPFGSPGLVTRILQRVKVGGSIEILGYLLAIYSD